MLQHVWANLSMTMQVTERQKLLAFPLHFFFFFRLYNQHHFFDGSVVLMR